MRVRRQVRVTTALFDQLDDQLRPDRGPRGEPSATDFVVLELPRIVERFATGFDAMPEIVEGVPSARMLITSSAVVRAAVVYGLLADDEVIDLIGIAIDP